MMHNFHFIPLKSIGEICFGENKENVRNKLGMFHEFKKSKRSDNSTDNFEFCHVYYDSENKCEAIEFIANKSTIDWEGNIISSLNYTNLKNLIAEYDKDIQINKDGFTSDKLQMSIYAPDKNNIETILVARTSYFSKQY